MMAKKRNPSPSRASKKAESRPSNVGRHGHACTVCNHIERGQIERDFLAWRSPITIATDYGLSDRATVYRHAHAFGLFAKRQRNLRAALEHIIEKASLVDANASAVVAAVQAYAKINAQGRWVERSEYINLNELFNRMTRDELETYAREGKLPDWFTQTVTATPGDSQEKGENGEDA